MDPLTQARAILAQSRRAAAFTGAGISTGSGIPDFRSPGGVWTRYRPVTIQEFMASADARRRYWEFQVRLDAGEAVPLCDSCGGFLKPATISFGQNLVLEVLEQAKGLARRADVMLVLGSSLVVYPAASIPEAAADAGARLVIVNREPTPLDGRAAAVLHGAIEEVLPRLV